MSEKKEAAVTPADPDATATDVVADAHAPAEPDTPPNDAPDAKPAASTRGGGKLVPGLLALCVIAIGVLGWQVWTVRGKLAQTQLQMTERLSAGDDMAREARAAARHSRDMVDGLQGKVSLLEAKAREAAGQAAALDSLYQEFSRTRDERAMAEIEQAVTIAGQQLQLAGNVEAALIALQSAEARLAALGDGRLATLRRSLARDIEQLKAAPRVDVAGITLKLEMLLESVDGLPLAFAHEAHPNPAPETHEKGDPMADPLGYAKAFALDVWAEVRAMVRVERLDAAADPVLLSPSQSTYLRENLKIRLLTARLALLGRDARTFDADMKQAVGWVERYFNLNDSRVSAALDSLKALQGTQIAPKQPALTETLSMLKTMQGRSGDKAPAATAPTEEPAQTQSAPTPADPSPAPAPADAPPAAAEAVAPAVEAAVEPAPAAEPHADTTHAATPPASE
ncbi:MAG: uroporphyrinogen-III C-methyltransferase [Rhodocyclaceae bacterium]|nr:uroporphyrinogen-III C-methyltransferase [Rhodocyclaceae bacterium]